MNVVVSVTVLKILMSEFIVLDMDGSGSLIFRQIWMVDEQYAHLNSANSRPEKSSFWS